MTPPRQRLLLFLAPADHPHRDAACATLAWLARAEGQLFECYFDARPTGSHYGGGLPVGGDLNDMRGGTFSGARHLEQLLLLLQRFEVEAAALAPSLLTPTLLDAGVRFRSRAAELATFYAEVFGSSTQPLPDTLLVVGQGRVAGGSLGAFAFPEIVHRRLLAVAEGDAEAICSLSRGRKVETLWLAGAALPEATPVRAEQTVSTAAETAWMAERWRDHRRGFLLGDAELVGRWAPTAIRRGWIGIHGMPQARVVERLARPLGEVDVVCGRQQDDRDFLALSRLGTAFQLVDPGRPPFPVLEEAAGPWPPPPPDSEPDDAQLRAWAGEGRVVSTLLFWTGMARELESLYPLADILGLTSLAAGLVLTTASFSAMPQPPLTLTQFPTEQGGLAPRVELLLASAGGGALIESAAPVSRFAATLSRSVDELARRLGSRERIPRGWWPVMDAPLIRQRSRRVSVAAAPPYVRLRYRPRPLGSSPTDDATHAHRRSLRALIRESPAGRLFEPIRPFTEFQPGPPGRRVLQAVRSAGFEYAFTTASFGGQPRAVVDIDGLIALNYTAGRWDGWTPFITVNALSDLRRAERRLLDGGRPGWLAGTIDTCLWAFTGPVWRRGTALFELCAWLAGGGSSGRLLNVTPRTMARYARVLVELGLVDTLPSA
ncbi:MAG TPA: hypothetical protein VEK76_00355 [Candidatus Binatia bacterium]|nr:hypothetical protein [Candidatus Binatia bacterium]